MKLLIAFVLGLGIFDTTPSATAQSATGCTPTTVIVIRHADRDEEKDRLLPKGVERAAELVRIFEHLAPDAVFHSNATRSRDTARPVLDLFKAADVQEYCYERCEPIIEADEISEMVLRKFEGKTVLIVAHSDTVAAIVKALSKESIDTTKPLGYNRVYIITVVPGQKTRVLAVQYGH